MAIATKQWTTGTVTAGSSLECNLVMDPAISLFAILKLEITPSAAGGLSTYQIWDTDGYDTNLLYEATANALSPFYDPVKIDSDSNMTEQGPAMLFMYEDADDSDELHIKIGNQAGVDRTYTVKIWFWNAEASTGMTSFDVAGDEGSNQTVTNASTLTFSGVNGITFSGTAGGIIAATVSAAGGGVEATTWDANSIVKADSDDTPVALTVGEQTLVGRITSGVITALSPTQVRTLINVEDGADVTDATNVGTAGAVMTSGDQSIADVKTFTSFPVTPSSAPTTNYQVANKKYVDDNVVGGGVLASTFNANTILKADSDDTPAALTVGEQTLVGRITSGVITALSATQVRTLLNVADGADVTGSNAPQAHKDSHDPEDGSDKLDTAAPAELAGVQAAGTGSSHSLARSDHQHQIQHSIANNHIVTIDQADAASGEFTRLTANGLESRSDAEVKNQLGYLTSSLDAALDANDNPIFFTEKVLTSGTSVAWDLADGLKATLTAGHNFTLKLTPVVGAFNAQCIITQDSTGSRVMGEIVTQEDAAIATTDVHADTDIIDLSVDIPTGARIRFATSDADLPDPLVAGTIYWAIRSSENHIKVATTKANAHAGTAVTLTDTGTGTHTVQQLAKWMSGTLGVLGTAKGDEDALALTYKPSDKQWYAQLGSGVFS